MRKRSASESSQGRSSSHSNISGRFRKTSSSSNIRRRRRQSQNSCESVPRISRNFGSSSKSKSTLPSILNDWKIIVQSMKENKGLVADASSSTSPGSQKHLKTSPVKKASTDIFTVAASNGVDKNTPERPAKSLPTPQKNKPIVPITVENKEKLIKQESDSTDRVIETGLNLEGMGLPGDVDGPEAVQKTASMIDSIIQNDTANCQMTSTNINGYTSPSVPDSTPEKEEEPDFVGFGSPDTKHLDCKETTETHAALPSPTKVEIMDIEQTSEYIEECKISMKDEIQKSNEESLFGTSSSDDELFEGFAPETEELYPCTKCRLMFNSRASLFHHVRFGHARIYSCIFDYGQCGQFKGSVALHQHLIEHHKVLYGQICKSFITDMRSNRISQFTEEERACSVCRMMLMQPEHCFHELCVHGIWPKSVINLGFVFIDQLVNIWWTGKALVYSCFVCSTTTKSIEFNVSSVAGFASSVQKHLGSHEIMIPTIQGWWLLVRFLASVDVSIRRTLSSLLCIGTEGLHGSCFICKTQIVVVRKVNMKFSQSLCHRCEGAASKKKFCWFGCKQLEPMKTSLLSHFITEHPTRLNKSAFCVKCGKCVQNLFMHIKICSCDSSKCFFCKESLEDVSDLGMIVHSFHKHAFQCPFPGCMISGTYARHHAFHKVLSSLQDGSGHLLTVHLPSVPPAGAFQIYSMLNEQALGQSKVQPPSLYGIWTGMNNSKYQYINYALTLSKFAVVNIKCTICRKVEKVQIFKDTKDVQALCKTCLLGFSSCTLNDIPAQCPAQSCLYPVSSEADLVSHLIQKHNIPLVLGGKLSCEACKKNSHQVSFKNQLGLMSHHLVSHRYACLVCPAYFSSEQEAHSHREQEHHMGPASMRNFLLHQDNINNVEWQFSLNKKPGICSVWNSDQKVNALWEAGFDDLPIEKPSASEAVSIPLNQAGDWCSSLCSVSMTGNQDVQITPKNLIHQSEMQEMEQDSSNDMCIEPDLLIPAVTVEDDENLSTTVQENTISSPVDTCPSNTSISKSTVTSFEPKANIGGLKPKKKKITKGLGENACIDENRVGNNIQIDLAQKFTSTCTTCGIGVSLENLGQHIEEFHSESEVQCYCGFKGQLCAYLVHTFHMSHAPCEASPIKLIRRGETLHTTLIVLERRSKTDNGASSKIPCYNCHKNFVSEKSRQLHYNLCKLEKKFQCEVCSQTFGLEAHLKKHIEWKHNHQNCELCGKEFTSKSSLHQHMIHIHKTETNQKCKECPEVFATVAQLKAHSRQHASSSRISSPVPSYPLPSPAPLLLDTPTSSTSTPTRRKRQPNKFNDDFVYSDSPSINLARLKMKRPRASDTDTDAGSIASPVHRRQRLPKKDSKALKPTKSAIGTKRTTGIVLPSLRPEMRPKDLVKIGLDCNPCKQEFDAHVAKLLHMYLLHPAMVLSSGFEQCAFCSYQFRSPDDVSDHHLDKHQRQFRPDGKFYCLCGMDFKEDGAYYFHLYYAHKAQRALSVGGNIVCRVCSHRPKLDKIVDLVVHLSDRHTMFDHVRYNDAYMCNFCYKAFESWTVLSLHFFMVHKASKLQTLSYDCPYCVGASPWHSLEALQYHLDGFHGGLNNAQTVPVTSRSIYTPAPVPVSPTKVQYPRVPGIKIKKLVPPVNAESPKSETLYCICQCPYDEVSAMIGCDNKKCHYQWFHFECVGIMSAPEGTWYCPDCESMSQHTSSKNDDSYSAPIKLSFANKGLSQTVRGSPSSSSSGSESSSSSNSSSSGSSSSDSSSESDEN